MPRLRSLVETAAIVGTFDLQGSRDDGRTREAAAPGGRDHDGVLDADPADAGEVHAGLDGDDVAVGQASSGGAADPRRLVDVEADAVAGPVQEGVGPAGFGDDRTAGPVDDGAYGSAHV